MCCVKGLKRIRQIENKKGFLTILGRIVERAEMVHFRVPSILRIHAVWKLQDFAVTQILREINFLRF